MSGQTRAINCTQCGAGQSVLGGGRVAAHSCAYCGAVLDAQDDFKVLAQHRDLPRPDTPLQVGLTGKLLGVDWTVIGTLGQSETYGSRTWEWVDHQLYSPTHGYAYLSFEDGHFTFTRKVRGPGGNGFYTHDQIESAENCPVMYRDGTRYRYYESGTSEISYVEGSFNWVPELGQKTKYISFMAEDDMVTQTQFGTEREVELSRYLPQGDVVEAFGLTRLSPPQGTHALQQLTPWAHGTFLRNAGIAAALAGLILWFVLLGQGQERLQTPYLDISQPQTVEFTIEKPNQLVKISLSTNVSNSWAWFDLELTDPSGETVAEFGRISEYYSGGSGEDAWSEGSRTATATLRLVREGPYQLTIAQGESGTWGRGRPASRMDVRVIEGKASAIWMFWASLACAACAGIVLLRRFRHRNRRWAGSDWSDE